MMHMKDIINSIFLQWKTKIEIKGDDFSNLDLDLSSGYLISKEGSIWHVARLFIIKGNVGNSLSSSHDLMSSSCFSSTGGLFLNLKGSFLHGLGLREEIKYV